MSFPFTTTPGARRLALTAMLVDALVAAALLGSIASSTWAAQTPPSWLYRITEGARLQVPNDPATVEARAIEVETEQLARGAEELHFPLLDDLPHSATRIKFEVRAPDDVTWRGTLDGLADHAVLLTLKQGVVVGLIYAPDALYEIGPTPDGGQRLARIDSAKFPPCGGAIEPEPPAEYASTSRRPLAGLNETRDRIDVMVVYTPEAMAAAGGTAGIEATIQAAVDLANTAFENSLMQTRFWLTHTALVDRHDSGSMPSDLSWVRTSAQVATLRGQHCADLVSLIVENGGGSCGLGYIMTSPGSDFARNAFQVTARDCAVGNLSWAHEHGHNMGMAHDPVNAAGGGAYSDSYGHYVTNLFRTVMSYPTPCGLTCLRVPYFSNPDVSYLGYPTGVLGQRDNHRTGELTGDIVANFRHDLDNDGDGWRCEDCDDSKSLVYPGAPQVCDGVNNDCSHPSWPAVSGTNEGDDDNDHFTECMGDCDDADPATYPGAPEINDGRDNQCGVGAGGGIVDEITGEMTLTDPSDGNTVSWTPQTGATSYEVARSLSPTFSDSCSRFIVPGPPWVDAQRPEAGHTFYYLVRPLEPFVGSWGQTSSGVERTNICSCIHDSCTQGDVLGYGCNPCVHSICDIDAYCCTVAWDQFCVQEVRTICDSLRCPESQGTCAHPLCTIGALLQTDCDVPPLTQGCVRSICNIDAYCCNVAWDQYCIEEVSSICGHSCQ